jgi:hypothetical protein
VEKNIALSLQYLSDDFNNLREDGAASGAKPD